MRPETLAALQAARAAQRPIVLATRLPDGLQHLFDAADAPPAFADAIARAMAEDKSSLIESEGARWFLRPYAPPYQLIVVGAVHIAQALVPLAVALGFRPTVIDPRGAFATTARFPEVTLHTDWPDIAVATLGVDLRTAIVTLTHDPKLDDPALDAALHSAAFYIGALGSRRTHSARLARLEALGHPPASLARIRGPIGLALGAVTAPEIALSVLAEIVATRRGAALGRRAV